MTKEEIKKLQEFEAWVNETSARLWKEAESKTGEECDKLEDEAAELDAVALALDNVLRLTK